MTNEVLVALITGGLAFLGVIVTNIGNNRKMQKELEKKSSSYRYQNRGTYKRGSPT